MEGSGKSPRLRVNRWINVSEDIIYVAIAVLLVVSASVLLVTSALTFIQQIQAENIAKTAVRMLDKLLLVLMMVEILYTVRVSFQEHTLIAEPFLIVGLIAAIRRVLVITAETWNIAEVDPQRFRMAMLEMALLTFMIITVVVSIILLRKYQIEKT